MRSDNPPFDFQSYEEENRRRFFEYRAAWRRIFSDEVEIAEAAGRSVASLVPVEVGDLPRHELYDPLESWTDRPAMPDVPLHLLPEAARGPEDWSNWLYHRAVDAGAKVVEARIEALKQGLPPDAERPLQERKDWGIGWPDRQPYGVSDRGAEHLVADWLRFLGLKDATVTAYGNDGGIDVESKTHIAQVKNYARARSVGVAEMRELAGVAAMDQRIPIFFTSGRFAAGALKVADVAGIAALIYDAENAYLEFANERGRQLLKWGIPTPPIPPVAGAQREDALV